MAHLILHHEERYNIFSTIVDQPIFLKSLSLKQLEDLIRKERGEEGVRELDKRLQRAHQKGCSEISRNIQDCVDDYNLSTNQNISLEQFIEMFLSK